MRPPLPPPDTRTRKSPRRGEGALTPHERLELIQRELDLVREQLAAEAAVRMMDRFHAFDAIKDDKCPACGGAVVVEETAREVTLKTRAAAA